MRIRTVVTGVMLTGSLVLNGVLVGTVNHQNEVLAKAAVVMQTAYQHAEQDKQTILALKGDIFNLNTKISFLKSLREFRSSEQKSAEIRARNRTAENKPIPFSGKDKDRVIRVDKEGVHY